VKYRPEMGIVLKNLNLEIKAGEKIAVVGRSGSGKSTLSLCLSRILEAHNGKILIDGIDISKLRLNILRENLTVIPKEPTIIEGTLRDNIDPHKKFSDEQITKVIRDVNLDYLFKEKSFNYEINESGNELSLGERQLICIARALLNKHKIVIINEIQTSIDYARDINTMENILKILKDSTVITITNKIHTIMNYDKILGLANGEVVEFDTPTNLIQNKKGIFYELYKESSI
jgi:ABC-type multidrug transport system fused ATPase/permease subunit